jgi:hypothetical protein
VAINLALKYEKKVDEAFKKASFTAPLVNSDYNFDGVDTIKIYRIPTVALNNYTRTGTNRYGNPDELQDEVDTYTLSTDKSFTFTIDKGNNQDQLNVKDAGRALKREIDQVIVPTQDKQVLSVIGAKAVSNSQYGTGAISKANAYEKFLDGQEVLDNKLVPTEGRVAVVNTSFYKAIKLDPSFTKTVDMATKLSYKGLVGEIDGVPVIKVPASYMPTNCEFIITHPVATINPKKLSDYKIHKDPPGINGNLVEGRVRYDTFVLEGKKDAIYAHFTSVSG